MRGERGGPPISVREKPENGTIQISVVENLLLTQFSADLDHFERFDIYTQNGKIRYPRYLIKIVGVLKMVPLKSA